jgi:hypothetical protein
MGRHSAGDEDDGTDVRLAGPAVAAPGRRGRHSRDADAEDTQDTGPVDAEAVRTAVGADADQDDQPTQRIGLVDLLAAAEEDTPAPPVAAPDADAPAAPRPARGNQSTAADLELLRKRPDVRARVIAAVVVPFVLYAAVLLLIGATAVQFLIFIWIPMVSAGVLAGLFLDAAHRRARAGSADAPPEA